MQGLPLSSVPDFPKGSRYYRAEQNWRKGKAWQALKLILSKNPSKILLILQTFFHTTKKKLNKIWNFRQILVAFSEYMDFTQLYDAPRS